MRRPALAKGHMRSTSCPPAITDEMGHVSQMAIQATTLTPRGPDHATGTTRDSTTSQQIPISDMMEFVSNKSKATSGPNEEAGSLSQLPTSQPEQMRSHGTTTPGSSSLSMTIGLGSLRMIFFGYLFHKRIKAASILLRCFYPLSVWCGRNCLATKPCRLAFNEWEGKGVFYPLSIHDSGTVELFAIACTLEHAISQIDGERTTAEERLRGDISRSLDGYTCRVSLVPV